MRHSIFPAEYFSPTPTNNHNFSKLSTPTLLSSVQKRHQVSPFVTTSLPYHPKKPLSPELQKQQDTKCTLLEESSDNSNSLSQLLIPTPPVLSQEELQSILQSFGDFPVHTQAMCDAQHLLNVIRRKFKMDVVILVRGCLTRRLYHSPSPTPTSTHDDDKYGYSDNDVNEELMQDYPVNSNATSAKRRTSIKSPSAATKKATFVPMKFPFVLDPSVRMMRQVKHHWKRVHQYHAHLYFNKDYSSNYNHGAEYDDVLHYMMMKHASKHKENIRTESLSILQQPQNTNTTQTIISTLFTQRLVLSSGEIGTLVCAKAVAANSASEDIGHGHGVLSYKEELLFSELVKAIEDIYYQRQAQRYQMLRSELALINGLVLSLRTSLQSLNQSGHEVAHAWQDIRAFFDDQQRSTNTNITTNNNDDADIHANLDTKYTVNSGDCSTQQQATTSSLPLLLTACEQSIQQVSLASDMFCQVIERTVMVAKGYLQRHSPLQYMATCAETKEKGFVATLNEYLLQFNAHLPCELLLWTFKTENFFSTCAHETYYHHLLLFLENVVYHWSARCSTIQLSIVFEDNLDAHATTTTADDDITLSNAKNSTPMSVDISKSIEVCNSMTTTTNTTTEHGWKLSDRAGFDHCLVGNIAMTLQFSDEFAAEEMSFPMEILAQILSLLNSSLSRLSQESAVQITPVRSFFQPKQEEAYVIRVPCTMYFTDSMYEAYEHHRRVKQHAKLQRDQQQTQLFQQQNCVNNNAGYGSLSMKSIFSVKSNSVRYNTITTNSTTNSTSITNTTITSNMSSRFQFSEKVHSLSLPTTTTTTAAATTMTTSSSESGKDGNGRSGAGAVGSSSSLLSWIVAPVRWCYRHTFATTTTDTADTSAAAAANHNIAASCLLSATEYSTFTVTSTSGGGSSSNKSARTAVSSNYNGSNRSSHPNTTTSSSTSAHISGKSGRHASMKHTQNTMKASNNHMYNRIASLLSSATAAAAHGNNNDDDNNMSVRVSSISRTPPVSMRILLGLATTTGEEEGQEEAAAANNGISTSAKRFNHNNNSSSGGLRHGSSGGGGGSANVHGSTSSRRFVIAPTI